MNGMLPGLLIMFQFFALASEEATAAPPMRPPQCGSLALYTLFQLEGRHVEWQALDSQMPEPGPHGLSMKDLQNVATANGLKLVGMFLKNTNFVPDRPLIVFLRRHGHGHFITVRPVGHSGKLVQVFDGVSEPKVVDADELAASNGWTGLALLPERPKTASEICLRIAEITGLGILIVCTLIIVIKVILILKQTKFNIHQ